MAGTGELRRLEQDLGKAAARCIPEVEKILKRGATNLKDDMRNAFEESEHFSYRGPRISYDRVGGFGSIAFEVGPERGGIGSLAHVAVDGGANGGGGSVDIDTPAQAEAKVIEQYISKAIGDLL